MIKSRDFNNKTTENCHFTALNFVLCPSTPARLVPRTLNEFLEVKCRNWKLKYSSCVQMSTAGKRLYAVTYVTLEKKCMDILTLHVPFRYTAYSLCFNIRTSGNVQANRTKSKMYKRFVAIRTERST